jgi:alkanesulfonate monooxygenase SsuD/methylene tetrahydromethanopterin reductase-like flavin-dependent oxidoreductase (luciferase family)
VVDASCLNLVSWAAFCQTVLTAAVDAVTLPMIRATTIYGSPEACRERLQAYRAAGLQQPIIALFPIGELIQETFRRTIEGCA